MADLRKAVLTKPAPQKRVAADKDNQSPLENPQNWIDARNKIAAGGWTKPKSIFYVVIAAGTVVDSPQKLKEIADMSSAPKTHQTFYKGHHTADPEPAQMGKDGKPMQVMVGAVSWEEIVKIRSKADCDWDLWVDIAGKTKGVLKVINYKKPAKPAGKPAAK